MTTRSTARPGTASRGIWIYAVLILVCVVVFGVVAYIVSEAQSKSYSATSTIIVQDPVLASSGGSSTAQTPGALAAVEAGRITRFVVSRSVASRIGDGYTPTSVAATTTAYVNPTSSVVEITSTARSAILAARIANAYAQDDAAQTNGAVEADYAAQYRAVRRQMAILDKVSNGGGVPAALASTLVRDNLLAISAQEVQLAQLANPPAGASSPKVGRNVGIVALVGLVVGVILADLVYSRRRLLARREDASSAAR